jgi:hypothetical protein
MFKKNGLLIFGSFVLISSIVVFKSYKFKEKLNKNKRYRLLEAILVDPYYD